MTYPQDLHIHTVFSDQDSSVVPEQTPELVARIAHAQVIGISDHFEHFADTIGMPIALLIIGVLLIGVGLCTERLSRRIRAVR